MSANLFFDNINKYLINLADQAAQGNALGLTNTAVHAENLFAEMLELIFGWKLVNANEKNRNQDTFDLINHKEDLLVQVTANKKYKNKYDHMLTGLASMDRLKVKRFVFVFLTKSFRPACQLLLSTGLFQSKYSILKGSRRLYSTRLGTPKN